MFYISTGSLTKMYTLRETFEETIMILGEPSTVRRDWYIQNLSTDADKAVARARELGYDVKHPDETLQDITRRNAEQMAEAKKLHDAAEELKADESRRKNLAEIKLAAEGLMPFGRRYGRSMINIAAEEGAGWIEYWIRTGRDEKATGVHQAIGAYLSGMYPEVAKLIGFEFADGYFGQEGTRYKEITATLIKSAGFESYYGYTYVETYATEHGLRLVYMGSAPPDVEKGQTVKMSFTVKSHEKYKDEQQTKIQRIKLN